MLICGGGAFQTDRTSCTKALKQTIAWHVQGTTGSQCGWMWASEQERLSKRPLWGQGHPNHAGPWKDWRLLLVRQKAKVGCWVVCKGPVGCCVIRWQRWGGRSLLHPPRGDNGGSPRIHSKESGEKMKGLDIVLKAPSRRPVDVVNVMCKRGEEEGMTFMGLGQWNTLRDGDA